MILEKFGILSDLQLDEIFRKKFPQNGLKRRASQQRIANQMLSSLKQGKIAICEAGVGTGKTYAYLLASMVLKDQSSQHKTVLISTSSIALQQAIFRDYLPKVAEILDRSIVYKVLKGKSHYICEKKLRDTMKLFQQHPKHVEDVSVLSTLVKRSHQIDLDEWSIRPYLKELICVERCHKSCKLFKTCYYQEYLRSCRTEKLDFIIVNHNLLVADALSRSRYSVPLIPHYDVAILDEAHKLSNVIVDMYGATLEESELTSFLQSVDYLIKHKTKEMMKLCVKIEKQSADLFEYLRGIAKRYPQGSVYINASGFARLRSLASNITKLLGELKKCNTRHQERVATLVCQGVLLQAIPQERVWILQEMCYPRLSL
ncbi:MAG: hypothetical protein R3Y07_04695 [Eubacteriales bacterium]